MTGSPRGISIRVALVFLGLVLMEGMALAQGIAGAVKDTSGAVMPGVTVEASSPALIEKVRSVVSDESGQYRIVDLRPGVYSVSFSLPGFRTVRRDGITLTTGFTANVDADLQVGQLEETVTVTGASPIVDVQNVRTQSVLSAEYLNTVPTGKSVAGYASLILGATATTGADVGGSKGEVSSALVIHGSRETDYRMSVDGMTYQYVGSGGGNARTFFINQLAMQEIAVETGGMGAESPTSGVQQNAVPKDGGNTYSLSAIVNYSGPDFVADNISDELVARGVSATAAAGIKKIYDAGAGMGGPIRRDKVWFYAAFRWWGADRYVPGSYFNKSPNPLFYEADLTRQGYEGNPLRNQSVRLTWQAAPKHKIAVSFINSWACQCYRGLSDDFRAPEATGNHTYPTPVGQLVWTSPVSDRLLFDVGTAYTRNAFFTDRPDGVTEDIIPITELSTGFKYGSKGDGLGARNYGKEWRPHLQTRASVSYVTGSHASKIGFTFMRSMNDRMYHAVNQAIEYSFRKPTPEAAPVPVSVLLWASPHAERRANQDVALFAQDQWTMNRLTINLGARFDWLTGWVPEQTRPAGRWVPELVVERINDVPNWKDVTPRVGAAYDLFGDGRTAVKVSLGKYLALGAISVNPATSLVSSATRVWNDVNGNYFPEEAELGPLSNSAFGTVRVNTRPDEDIVTGWGRREYNWETSASIQHELRPGLGANIGYFRRMFGNFRATDNLLVTPANYTPYCVTSPSDPRLPGGGGQQVCGLFDITPTAFGQVSNLLTEANNFGEQSETYDGIDVGLGARFGRGGVMNGGLSTGRTKTNTCFVVDSPQQLYLCEVSSPATQFKFNGAYPMPWDIQLAWTYQNLQGIPVLANNVFSNAQIAPSLGRNLGSCGTRVPCNGTATVNLIEPGTVFEDRYTQLDLRLTKGFRLGGASLRGMFDAYNVLNASAITARNNAYGTQWGRPSGLQLGRLFKVGAQLEW